jgi:hypothetical protein
MELREEAISLHEDEDETIALILRSRAAASRRTAMERKPSSFETARRASSG